MMYLKKIWHFRLCNIFGLEKIENNKLILFPIKFIFLSFLRTSYKKCFYS